MQAVYRQHKAMMGLEQSKWFNVPVNPKKFNIPTYPIYIKRPMDLGTIKKKLVNQQPQLPFTLHTHTQHTQHATFATFATFACPRGGSTPPTVHIPAHIFACAWGGCSRIIAPYITIYHHFTIVLVPLSSFFP